MTGQAEETSVTVAIASTPTLERLRPKTDRACVMLTISLHGTPLRQGHIKLQLTAPPRTTLGSTGLPRVEGTPLLVLDSEFRDGTFTLQYVFPIRGLYTFDLEMTPVPEGPAFPPTTLRQTVRIAEHLVVARHVWLLIGGLFVLGSAAGVRFARTAAARAKRIRRISVGLLMLCYGVLAPVSTVCAHTGHSRRAAHTAQGPQVIRGVDGWELEVHAHPEPARVGQLVALDLWLRKDGAVFPGMTGMSTAVTNLEEGQMVVETHILARQGSTTQRLQLYDGGLHTIAMTVHPVGGAASGWAPPTVVLNMDVVALHPPLAVQIRRMTVLLSVLVAGMVVGFFVPRPALFKRR